MKFLEFLKATWETLTLPKKHKFDELEIPINSFPDVNTGIAPGEQQLEGNYVAGTTNPIKYEVILPSGDWRDFLPSEEKQSYQNFDSMSCVSFSNNNSAEMQLKQSTGLEFNFSDRSLSVLSETTKQGNYLYKVADVPRKIGRILEADYPNDGANTWEDFEKPLPTDLIKKAYRFNEVYQWIPTDLASLRYYLKQSPIQLIINDNTHAVCLVYADETGYYYYDSYPPFLKKTTVRPNWALQIIVKPMTIFAHRKNTSEYAFIVPAPDIDSLKARGEQLGYPIVNSDGIVAWDKAKEAIY